MCRAQQYRCACFLVHRNRSCDRAGRRRSRPGTTNLRPALRAAIEAASAAAQEDGASFEITSGWRSPRLQEQLVVDGVAQYGSEEEACRYVSPPDVSSHVTVDAFDGQTWLLEHGADHGLCRIYENERWHVELTTTPGGTCPALLPDASAGWGVSAGDESGRLTGVAPARTPGSPLRALRHGARSR